MFEATSAVVSDAPFALVPLLAGVAVLLRSLRRRGVAYSVARSVVVTLGVPLVALAVLSRATGDERWGRLASALLDAAVSLLGRALAVLDDSLAAALRAFVGAVDSLAGPVGPLAGRVAFAADLPEASVVARLAGTFLVVFALEAIASAVLAWLVGRSIRDRSLNEGLAGVGAVLFVAGLSWTLLGSNALSTNVAALAAAAGLVAGVSVAVRCDAPDALDAVVPAEADDDAAASDRETAGAHPERAGDDLRSNT